jgi:hypothetical protein
MRLVRTLLLMEVAFAVASRCGRLTRTVLGPEALHRRPGIDQRAIDRKMLARQQLLHLRQGQQCCQELARHLRLQKSVAVVREHRRVPDLGVHWQADKPAEQQIVVDLLHQHPLGAHREERLQQRCPQLHLRRDRRAPHGRVKPLKSLVQRCQGFVGQRPYRPQRVIRRNALLKPNV